MLLQEKNQKKQAQGALYVLLSYALRAAFGGCALHAPAGAAAIRSALLKNPPGRTAITSQHLNDRRLWTYGLAVGGGSALAALPMSRNLPILAEIGTFLPKSGSKLRCDQLPAMRPGGVHRGGWIGLRLRPQARAERNRRRRLLARS